MNPHVVIVYSKDDVLLGYYARKRLVTNAKCATRYISPVELQRGQDAAQRKWPECMVVTRQVVFNQTPL